MTSECQFRFCYPLRVKCFGRPQGEKLTTGSKVWVITSLAAAAIFMTAGGILIGVLSSRGVVLSQSPALLGTVIGLYSVGGLALIASQTVLRVRVARGTSSRLQPQPAYAPPFVPPVPPGAASPSRQNPLPSPQGPSVAIKRKITIRIRPPATAPSQPSPQPLPLPSPQEPLPRPVGGLEKLRSLGRKYRAVTVIQPHGLLLFPQEGGPPQLSAVRIDTEGPIFAPPVVLFGLDSITQIGTLSQYEAGSYSLFFAHREKLHKLSFTYQSDVVSVTSTTSVHTFSADVDGLWVGPEHLFVCVGATLLVQGGETDSSQYGTFSEVAAFSEDKLGRVQEVVFTSGDAFLYTDRDASVFHIGLSASLSEIASSKPECCSFRPSPPPKELSYIPKEKYIRQLVSSPDSVAAILALKDKPEMYGEAYYRGPTSLLCPSGSPASPSRIATIPQTTRGNDLGFFHRIGWGWRKANEGEFIVAWTKKFGTAKGDYVHLLAPWPYCSQEVPFTPFQSRFPVSGIQAGADFGVIQRGSSFFLAHHIWEGATQRMPKVKVTEL